MVKNTSLTFLEQAVFDVQVGLSHEGPAQGDGNRNSLSYQGLLQSYICHIKVHVMVDGKHNLLHPDHC